MNLSDLIEEFIRDQLENSEGYVEIQRQFIAERFNCVPSQINYVISTRFTSERGFSVESRRGGGGYIKICRSASPITVMHIVNSIGGVIDYETVRVLMGSLCDLDLVTPREVRVILSVLSDNSLPPPNKAQLRAQMLKTMLLNLADTE